MKGDGEPFKEKIQSLSGRHRKQDIQVLSWTFWLQAKKIIDDITQCLQTQDYTAIKDELKKYADSYKKYHDRLHDEKFLVAQEIFDLLAHYIDKVVSQTQDKLTNILLQYPGSESQSKVIYKALNPQEKTEWQEQIPEQETSFIGRLKKILDTDTSDDIKIENIEKDFLSTFELQRLSWKKFYRELWLKEDYVSLIKDIDLEIINILIQIKNTQDDTIITTLNTSLEEEMKKYTWKTKAAKPEKNIWEITTPIWPKVVGKVELPNDPRWERKRNQVFKKPEVVYTSKAEEEKQPETTDSLDLVGKNMSIWEFLAAASLEYDEINNYIQSWRHVPARYFGCTTSKRLWTLHFFTIGQEKRWSNDILINVSIINQDKQFHEWEIYEIVLTEISQNSKAEDDQRKQSYFVKWVFKESLKWYNKTSVQKLWDNEALKTLSKKHISEAPVEK